MTEKVEGLIFAGGIVAILVRFMWGHTPIRALILILIFLEALIQQALKSIYAGLEHFQINFLDTFREERQSLSQGPNFRIVRKERNG